MDTERMRMIVRLSLAPLDVKSLQVRLRMVHHTDRKTLEAHVHQFTLADTTCNTDEWQCTITPFGSIVVCHAKHEWARDDDGDGIRGVHINSAEGMWTDVRRFSRDFKGVHKDYLSGYVAIAEFRRNLKRISPDFIAAILTLHMPCT